MILPRSGSTACVRRSRPSFAEPPADAPSTRNSSRYWGSRSEHSASFAASPSSSTPFLRVSSRALRAASRAWAARTHLSAILRAVVGSSSKASGSLSLTTCWTSPLMSLLPSLDVVARDAALEVLQEVVALRVARDRAGQRRPEAGEVRAALARVDVVGEREHALLIAIVVLQRHLDFDVALAALEEQHLWVHRGLVLVQVLDELDDAALVQERVAAGV